jgi:hypothetical protein
MTTFITDDREEADDYLRKQIRIQQNEIDRLKGRLMIVEKERDAYHQAYQKLLDGDKFDIDGRC